MNSIRYLDIDSLNERLAELEGFRDTKGEAEIRLENAKAALIKAEVDGLEDLTAEETELEEAESEHDAAESDFGLDEAEELERLEILKNEIGESRGKIDDSNGPFIHENDFEDYARELADNIGAIPKGAGWPCTCIDWERAARELQMDYSSVEWCGDTYLYRS